MSSNRYGYNVSKRNSHATEIYRRRRTTALVLLVLVIVVGLAFWLWPTNSESSLHNTSLSSSADTHIVTPLPSLGVNSTQPSAIPTVNIPPGTPKCSDDDIAVSASTDKTSYGPGERPILKAIVTNIGPNICVRDVGTGLEKFTILDFNGNQVWTNFDCDAQPGMHDLLLKPGQQVGFNLQWQAHTSVRGCPLHSARPVAPGQYQVIAQLNMVSSKPNTFNINPATLPNPVRIK